MELIVSYPPHFEGGVVEETIQKIVPVFVSIAQTVQIVKPFLQKILFSGKNFGKNLNLVLWLRYLYQKTKSHTNPNKKGICLMKQVKVFCTNTQKNQMDFFVSLPTETVYLFTVKYFSNPIYQEYKNGIAVEKLFHTTRNFRQQTIREHLLRNLKDLEKTYNLPLFRKSKKWNRYPQTKHPHSITQAACQMTPQQDAA